MTAYANEFISSGAWDREILANGQLPGSGGHVVGDIKQEIDYIYKYYINYQKELDDYLGVPHSTGINTVRSAQATNRDFYNLAGQKVTDSYKGIVIHNGKKITK